jgi:endonuclease III
MVRLGRLVAALREFYGVLPAPPADAFTLLVWDVLAARTTPFKRDAAMAALRRIPALTPDSMFRAPQGKLESAVRFAGPYLEQRLQALRSGAEAFRRHLELPALLHGPLPAARRALGGLPPLAEGEAQRMLLFAGNQRVLPMDPGTVRVGARLGYGSADGPHRRAVRSVRHALAAEVEPAIDAYRETATYLSHHAVATCLEREPHCGVCPLAADCPSANFNSTTRPGA